MSNKKKTAGYIVLGCIVMSALFNSFISVNVETVAEKTESTGFLLSFVERLALLLDRLFDPVVAWVFWLALGIIIGGLLFQKGDKLEDAQRGLHYGPSFLFLRMEVLFVRLGIRYRWIAKVGGTGLNKAFENLATVLPEKHGLAPLPARNFEAKEKRLRQTSEYLRKVRHHLNDRDIADARLLSQAITKR